MEFQAAWAGYYVEPRMTHRPGSLACSSASAAKGFMLAQYLTKLYVDALVGKPTPDYFTRLALTGDGLCEEAFK